jgi:hypothetical protein
MPCSLRTTLPPFVRSALWTTDEIVAGIRKAIESI